jgi:hypothetical protein
MIEKLEQVFTNSEKNIYETIQEQLMGIDTTDLSDEVSEEILTDITPEKVYFWTRIYLKDENPNIEIGDEITLKWTPSGEELKTQFITYGKKGLEKDHDDQVVNYNSEEDKKIICLMVDEKVINESNDIPFIRTLFKLGRHYENQLVRRDELIFINQKNGIQLDYYDCDF